MEDSVDRYSELIEKSHIQMLRAGIWQGTSADRIEHNNLLCFKMILMVKGVIAIEQGSNVLRARAHDVVIIPPFFPYNGKCLSNEVCFFFFFLTLEDRESFIFNRLSIRVYQNLLKARNSKQMGKLIEAWDKREKGSYLFLFHEIQKIILSLLETDSNEIVSKNPRLNMIVRYIQQNIASNIKVQELCELFYLSNSALYSLFRKELKVSPQVFILRQKVNHSLFCMHDTSLCLEDLARNAGFSSLQHFSRAFKKNVGQSPARFRRQMAAEEGEFAMNRAEINSMKKTSP